MNVHKRTMALKIPKNVMSLLVGGALNLGFLSIASAQGHSVIINGTPVKINETSVKCDLGEIPNVSKKRLVDCDSAELVELEHRDIRKQAVKFSLKPLDKQISDGVRAELRDMHEAVNGDEIWYRFSTLLPRNFPMQSKHRLVLSQWHERIRGDGESLRPPLSHRLWNGRFVVTLWNKDRVAEIGAEGDGEILFETEQFELGVFHEFVYKIIWSPESDGKITGWTRQCEVLKPDCSRSIWREIIRYKGSTGYDSDKVMGYYFKLGLYTVVAFDVPFTAYHKDYRAGPDAMSVGATDALFQ